MCGVRMLLCADRYVDVDSAAQGRVLMRSQTSVHGGCGPGISGAPNQLALQFINKARRGEPADSFAVQVALEVPTIILSFPSPIWFSSVPPLTRLRSFIPRYINCTLLPTRTQTLARRSFCRAMSACGVSQQVGGWPIVLSAPHSGRDKHKFPERKHGVFCDDEHTRELQNEISEAINRIVSCRPYSIQNHLLRKVCEMNRAPDETHNSSLVMKVYDEYHDAISDSLMDSIRRYAPLCLTSSLSRGLDGLRWPIFINPQHIGFTQPLCAGLGLQCC